MIAATYIASHLGGEVLGAGADRLSRLGFCLRRGFGDGLLLGRAKGLPYLEDVDIFEDFDDLVVAEFEQPVIGLVVTASRFQRHRPVGYDRNAVVLGRYFAIGQLGRSGLGIEDRR